MRRLISTAVIVAFCLGQSLSAQEKADTPTQEELMAKYIELAAPGEEHKLLEKLAGAWDFEATMWVTPGAEAAVYPGKAEGKMVLGGRFLYGEFTTEADRLRKALLECGIQVVDTPEGTRWKRVSST